MERLDETILAIAAADDTDTENTFVSSSQSQLSPEILFPDSDKDTSTKNSETDASSEADSMQFQHAQNPTEEYISATEIIARSTNMDYLSP